MLPRTRPSSPRFAFFACAIAVMMGCRPARSDPPRPPQSRSSVTWLKGQLHVHSSNSHDGHAPPDEVARWYEARGYDFIVFTDHDFVTQTPPVGRMLVMTGAELTRNLKTCDPRPDPAELACKLHVNALFANRPGPVAMPHMPSQRRVDIFQQSFDVARDLGALAQLNHPTEEHAVDAALLLDLARRGLLLLEVANQGHRAANAGGGRFPSSEALWDAALTAGATLWGAWTQPVRVP